MSKFLNFLFQYQDKSFRSQNAGKKEGRTERREGKKQSLQTTLFCIYFFFQKDISILYFQWLISGPSWYGVMTLLSIAGICRIKMSLFKYKIFKDLKYR
jgi:hypothetical protein